MISRLDINFELVYFFHNPSYSVTDMLLCDSLDIIDLKTQRMCYGDFQLRDVMLELWFNWNLTFRKNILQLWPSIKNDSIKYINFENIFSFL